MGSNGLLLPPPPLRSEHNYTLTDVASTHPREYEGRHASRTSARRERQHDLTTSTLLQPVSVPRAPRGSTYEPESISAPILRGRSDSSASSVSAVTCPESPPFSSDSDSSLVEPLDLDDPAPIYPIPPAKRTGYAPLISAPGRAARSPSPSLVRNFSNVTLRPDRRGSSSSPVASTSKSVPRQPLLSPLNMQTGFTSTTLRSPSVISTNSLRNMFKIDKANLPIYSVHASDSEESEEEPVQPSPRSAKSPAESPAESASRIRLRKHLEKVNWPESPSHVKPDVHDAKFDPRSPIHQETRVPQDTT
ncbi:hypothetical protein ONZ45_g4633 [Pleurotus djamor]|nr:hypothetical protein ONZ45_g4633 [Pleurotus djamor]